MKIRRARPEDAEKLSQIARAAKSYWNYPEKWLILWKNDLQVTREDILKNEVFAMSEKDEIIGFYELKIDEKMAALEHLWINPENIRSGIGRKLFAHALEKAVLSNAEVLNILSDPNAEGFYKKMGAKRIGDIVSEIEGNGRILPLMQLVL